MSSLISSTEMLNSTGVFQNIFDSWSRQIIIFKEPIKQQILPQNSSALFGFGSSQSTELYNYTPITGVFPALIRYNDRYASKDKSDQLQSEINEYISDGPVSIKVRQDCRDFIIVGKTQKIQIDNQEYLLDDVDFKVDYFFQSMYYIFDLERKM
jgi:hypothetical protein